MAKSEKKEENQLLDSFHNNRLQIFFKTGGYTIVLVAFFAGLGYLADLQFGTKPTFFIIGLVAGYPLTQIYIFKKFKKFGNKEVEKYKDSKGETEVKENSKTK